MLHFPVMKVWFPAKIMVHFKNFVPIVNFDLMGEIKTYTDILEEISQHSGIQNEPTRRLLMESMVLQTA